MMVECMMGQNSKVSTIYIRFAKNNVQPMLHTKRVYSGASTDLTHKGIMGLGLRMKLDFVTGVLTGKYIRPLAGVHAATSTYN